MLILIECFRLSLFDILLLICFLKTHVLVSLHIAGVTNTGGTQAGFRGQAHQVRREKRKIMLEDRLLLSLTKQSSSECWLIHGHLSSSCTHRVDCIHVN